MAGDSHSGGASSFCGAYGATTGRQEPCCPLHARRIAQDEREREVYELTKDGDYAPVGMSWADLWDTCHSARRRGATQGVWAEEFANQVFGNVELRRLSDEAAPEAEEPPSVSKVYRAALAYATRLERGDGFDTPEECLGKLLAESRDDEDRFIIQKLQDVLGPKPPAVLNNSSPGVQCAVVARIGRKNIRILLDTGAVQSMISSEAAQASESQSAMADPVALKRPLKCEGAEKGRVIGRVEWAVSMRVHFGPPSRPENNDDADSETRLGQVRAIPKSASVLGQFYIIFYIIDNLSDGLILGLPEMSLLGAYLEPPDPDGRRWVQFTVHAGGGLRLPLIQTRRDGPQAKLVDIVEAEGPSLLQVSSVMTKEEYEAQVE